jgi:peptidoglycan/xylan/chitin deacetylase (PgdA/CDA1 family)
MTLLKRNSLILFLLLALSSLFYYAYQKNVQELESSLKLEQEQITKLKNYFAIKNIVPKEGNKTTANNNTSTKSLTPQKTYLTLPITIYHYIRDYSDPTDQLGINLSVAPETFALQLDQIKKLGYTTITFEDIAKNQLPKKPIMLTFDDGYLDFYTSAFPELKKRNMKAVAYIITSPPSYGEYMTAEQIKEVASYGIEIGSHTISHPNLAAISAIKATEELTISKKSLENIIQKPVISLCYPSGKYDANTIELAKTAGYKYAVTTVKGLGNLENPYEISRYKIGNSPNIFNYVSLK